MELFSFIVLSFLAYKVYQVIRGIVRFFTAPPLSPEQQRLRALSNAKRDERQTEKERNWDEALEALYLLHEFHEEEKRSLVTCAHCGRCEKVQDEDEETFHYKCNFDGLIIADGDLLDERRCEYYVNNY